MKRLLVMTAMVALLAPVLGCATTTSSEEHQRQALVHQQKSDEAAKAGMFGVAGAEQRKAADAHNRAVFRAIKDGKPIPDQTKIGDLPATPAPGQ